MPNYIALKSKVTGKEHVGSGLIAVDDAMREHFGAAIGETWEQMRVMYHDDPEALAIIAWLELHYDNSSYYCPR